MKAGEGKFKEAAEALFEGDADRAAQLFNEGAQAIVAARPTLVQDDLVRAVTANVKQDLAAKPAVDKLFADYPEIKADDDLQLLADRRVNLYMKRGSSQAEAIEKAGEDVAEKFKLGKHKQRPSQPSATHGEPEPDDATEASRTIREMQESRASTASEATSGRQTAQAHDGLKDEHARLLAFRRHRASQQQ
ncbi:MAG: hypothetical protein M3Y27_12085 [Acidobacteriota bacterium]|nr:hypothetical protein [Acidobacteriota bacterium]